MAEELESRGGEAESAVNSLEGRIRADISRVKRGTIITLVVGLILFAIIFGYLSYLIGVMESELEPNELAATAAGLALPKIPELVGDLETRLADGAPEHIAGLRREVMKQAPAIRELAEENILMVIAMTVNWLDETLDDWIGTLIDEHKDELKPLIEAAAIEDEPEALEMAFRQSLDELILPELDKLTDKFHNAMDMVEARLQRLLLPDENLEPDEIMAKEWITALMIIIDNAAREQIGEPLPDMAVEE